MLFVVLVYEVENKGACGDETHAKLEACHTEGEEEEGEEGGASSMTLGNRDHQTSLVSRPGEI
jgi:hypothetical protein